MQTTVPKATESYKRVVKSSKIDFKIKQRVLNEYLIFATKNHAIANGNRQYINLF